ncbi:MAG: SRPBCC domain-containing protein [Candidatus Sulfotelmatobacter sp.]
MKETEVSKALNEPELNLNGQPGTIVQEHRYDASIDKVWQSLTEPNHLNNWFGMTSSVTPGVGGSMRHSWGEPVVEECTIQIWEPNARLKVVETTPFGVTFQPSDGPSKTRTIDYNLSTSGEQTVLKYEYDGFGTTPEWQKFQSAVSSCAVYQLSALGQYVKSHFGEKRSVSWARTPSPKSYGEMWSRLTGEGGILAEGSFAGLNRGDKYSIRAVTGDVFEGVVISHVPNKQFAGTVENLNNSLLRIVLDRPGATEAGVWLASWGAKPAASQMFEWRWTHALQTVLS